MRLFRIIGAAAVLLLAFTYCLLEAGHFFRFGHFFPLGLHADVVVSKAVYEIPGISRAYNAKSTNFGITPVKVKVCDFIDDAMISGTVAGASIEKWSPLRKRWKDIFKDIDRSSWCHPFPLGIVEAQVTTKKLWPFQSALGSKGAIAGYDVLAIGDRARFGVFPGNRLAHPYCGFLNRQAPDRSGCSLSSSPLNTTSQEPTPDYRGLS